jgi:hypothetical protein
MAGCEIQVGQKFKKEGEKHLTSKFGNYRFLSGPFCGASNFCSKFELLFEWLLL